MVLAILVAAFAVMITAWLTLAQGNWVAQAQNRHDRDVLAPYHDAIIDWVRLVLNADLKANAIDGEMESWAHLQPDFELAEGGHATVQVSDETGRFNLNTIVRNGTVSVADLAILQRLLRNLGLSPALAQGLWQWLEANPNPEQTAAADAPYLALSPPYRAARQLLVDVDELRWVQGFDAATINRLRPFVAALPDANTTININTAPKEILMALGDGLSSQWADQVIRVRQQKPFTSVADFLELLPAADAVPGALIQLGVSSTYFRVSLHLSLHDTDLVDDALLSRIAGQGTQVVWQKALAD